MRGIILAGGKGTRLSPLTSVLNKQILPIYDKPMIYYPLATLMAAGIREILIITNPEDANLYKQLLSNGSKLGIKISYEVQAKPTGIADAFIIGKDFIGLETCALILGDNLFHGTGLGRQLMDLKSISGCHIFAHRVADPASYGVIEFNKDGKPEAIIEKPINSKSNFAIPGLYFFDNSVVDRVKKTEVSERGELEITGLLNSYLADNTLQVTILARGTIWLDTGTVAALHDAATYVRLVEERQGNKIACIEEIAWRQEWITTEDLLILAGALDPSPYSSYLKSIIHDEETRIW